MICPILHPATLCKQHFSGLEESHSQEVSTSQYEQDVGEGDKKDLNRGWFIWVFNNKIFDILTDYICQKEISE